MRPTEFRSARALRRRFAACTCLWMAAGSVASESSVRIGVIGPFTGPSAEFGQPMLQGIQLAAEEINRVGGFLGRPFELVIKDDRGNPDEGVRQSKALLAENVNAVIGFCNSGVALKSLDIFQQARIPLLVPCATNSAITGRFPAQASYIFRNSAHDAIQAAFLVQLIQSRGWSKVAVFADRTGYGEGGLKDLSTTLAAKGLKPAHVARFDLGVQDLSEEMKAARAAGADVIVSYAVGAESAVVAKSRLAVGWKVAQVGTWALSAPQFLAAPAAEGALVVQTFIAEPTNERRAAFLSAYARKFGGRPMKVPMAVAQSYDSTYMLLYGIFNIPGGNVTGPKLKAALETLPRPYRGVIATYDKPFGELDKESITPEMLIAGRVHNGAITYANPEDIKRNLVIKRKSASQAGAHGNYP